MENMEEKQQVKELSFESLFILTELLEKMGAETLIDTLEEKLQEIEDKEMLKIKELPEEEKEEAKKKLLERKKNYGLKEILKFVIIRPHKAKNEIMKLVSDYSNIPVEEVKTKGLKWTLEQFKELLKSGIWDVVKDLIGNKEKLDNLKKTLL